MKVLLIGEKYSTNLGDGVIYDVVEKICIEKLKLECEEFDLSGQHNFVKDNIEINGLKVKLKEVIKKNRFMHKYLSLYTRVKKIKTNLKKVNFKELDAAIFVGGQLFMEYFSLPIYIITKELNKNNIPVIFNCCGWGKFENKLFIKFLEKAINMKNVRFISLRDNLSIFDEKLEIKHINKVEQTLDPVFELNYFYDKKDFERKDLIGIGIMPPYLFSKKNNIDISEEQLFSLIDSIIEKFEFEKCKWEFFVNGSKDDYDCAYRYLKSRNYSLDKLYKRPTTPIELIKTIARYKSIFSMRLHSHIIANSLGITSIGLVWDNKVREFSKIIKRENSFIDFSNTCKEDVLKSIDNMINGNLMIKEKYFVKLTSEFLKESIDKVKRENE